MAIHSRCKHILNQTSSSHFRLTSGHRNEREYYVHLMTALNMLSNKIFEWMIF